MSRITDEPPAGCLQGCRPGDLRRMLAAFERENPGLGETVGKAGGLNKEGPQARP